MLSITFRVVVALTIDITLIGVATVFLLIACQNVESLLNGIGVKVSFCYWLLVITAGLIPLSWLGTPKDIWYVPYRYKVDIFSDMKNMFNVGADTLKKDTNV